MIEQAATDEQLLAQADQLKDAHQRLLEQMRRVIVGQEDVMDELLIALFCRGHCILEGVPGLAKTLMISTLAKLLSLDFGRIQFTPDLMPSDITGTEVLEEDQSTGKRMMRFVRGPLFANIVLADEVNRTPPKTQAALLQAMQEYQVTVAGESHDLEPPFFVLGTQNPIENEGTYPLPEAQLDRFLFRILVDYPTHDEEVRIAMDTTRDAKHDMEPVLDRTQILQLQQVVRQVVVAEPIADYAVRLVRSTRPRVDGASEWVKRYVEWGAGPRASQSLLLGAKARALLSGRVHVAEKDVRSIAKPVLRHRVVPNFAAESEGMNSDAIIDRLMGELSA